MRPGSYSVRIDGVDDDEFSGGSRTELSPEAINHFQIVNHGFTSESGGAAGGAVDVQTRTGLNHPHGDAFLFVQNGALNATPHWACIRASRMRIACARVWRWDLPLNPLARCYIAAEQELARGEDTNDLQPSTVARLNAAVRRGPLSGFALSSGEMNI